MRGVKSAALAWAIFRSTVTWNRNFAKFQIACILGKYAAYSTRFKAKMAVCGKPRFQCREARLALAEGPNRPVGGGVGVMRFLLRLTFWLGVIAVLFPGSGSQPASGPQVSATEAMSAAKATVGDMRQFCERQPDACTVGSQAAQALGDRARAGAKRLYELLNQQIASGDRDAAPAGASAGAKSVPLPPPRPSQNTLVPADLAPTWRGPLPHKAAQRSEPEHDRTAQAI
jgi:hypothetical protein